MMISPGLQRNVSGRETVTDPGRGSAAQISNEPRTPVLVMYGLLPPGMRQLRLRWILMAAGVVVQNMFVFLEHGGILSGRCFDWPVDTIV